MSISIDNIFGDSTPSGKSTTPVSSSKVSLDNIFASTPVSGALPGLGGAGYTPAVQSAVDSVKAPKVTTASKTSFLDSYKSTVDKIGNQIGGVETSLVGGAVKGLGNFVDFIGGNLTRGLNKVIPLVPDKSPSKSEQTKLQSEIADAFANDNFKKMDELQTRLNTPKPFSEIKTGAQKFEDITQENATKYGTNPVLQNLSKGFGEFIGEQAIPMWLSGGILNASGTILASKVPMAGEIINILKNATSPTASFMSRYGVSGAKTIATAALSSLALNNKKTIIENALDNIGSFAAFHAASFPLAELFRPVFTSLGQSSWARTPENNKLLTDTKTQMEGQTTTKTLWYKNANGDIMKVDATGAYPASTSEVVASGTKVTDVPVLTKVEVEAFKKNPSLFQKLTDWVTGKKPLTETKFEGETPKTESTTPTKENLTELAQNIKEGKPIENGPTIKPRKTEISTIASQFKQKVPSIEGVNKESTTKLTMEQAQPLADKAITQYWNDKIQPSLDKGEATVIGADDMKDHFGKDYNENNHPVYSRAAFQTYEKALEANKNPNVIFTGGGPASGKTELLIKTISPEFPGVMYDSNMANYDGFKKQVQMARDAKKEIEVYGIIPNLDNSRTFSIQRENQTGRGINDTTFAHGHAGFPNTVLRALEEGIIKPEEVKLFDTRKATSFEEAFTKVINRDYVKDPLALLKSLEYNEDTLKKIYGKQHYNKETGEPIKTLAERNGDIRVRSEAGNTLAQDRANKGDAINAGNEGLLEQTQGGKGRIILPEVPTNLKRITDYQTRLKLRGADPVLVDAIISPLGDRAYGVSVGGTLTFEKVVQKFTEDHEIFHQVFQNFDKMRIFDNFYKKGLLAEAKTMYGDLTPTQLEENLASDFQQYVNERESGKQSTFFDKIKEFFDRLYAALKRIFRTQRDINEFYRVVYEGKGTNEVKIQNTMPESFSAQQKAGVVDFRIQAWNDIKFKLKESTGLTAKDIVAKHPDVELKRDIIITDVYGEKATLKQGEGITPYEMTGNKFILQDGEAFLVSKSQAQNVINNSITSVTKEFAPELKQTEETIKGDVLAKTFDDINWKDVSRPGEGKILNGTLGDRQFIIQQENDGYYVAEKDGLLGRQAKNYTDAVETLNRYLKEQAPKTKYSQYTLPGGTNYKEILIQAPGGKISPYLEWEDRMRTKYGNSFNEKISGIERQEGLKLFGTGAYEIKGFTGSHWSEPNVISHIRMNERTLDGKKIAFMEELQSDWAREGRSKGFIEPQKQLTQRQIKDKQEQELNDAGVFVEQDMSGEANLVDKDGELLEYDDLTPRQQTLVDNFNGDAQSYAEIYSKGISDGVPNNPLLKNWQELSIKRALQEAVNSNAKYFAWINGPQTAARYNLSKEVKDISWEPENSVEASKLVGGRKVVKITPVSGGKLNLYIEDGKVTSASGDLAGNTMVGKPLGEAIGKGIADKILTEKTGDLSGEGLNIGGEWATTLYDKQVPNIIKNLTGAEVKTLDMGLASDNNKELEMYKRDLNLLETEKDVVNREAKITELKKKIASIPVKKATQMAIELTPEVKAIINGEARQIAKPSGVLPFEKQVTAPPMFNLKPKESISGLEVLKYATDLGGETIGSNAKEAIKSQDFKIENVNISDILKNDLDAKEYVDANKNRYGKQKQGIDNPIIIGNWQGKSNAVIDGYNRLLTKIQNGDTTIKAYVAQTVLDKKFPKFETGNKLEDAKAVLNHIENKLGVSSAVKSIKDQELAIEIGKEVLDMSPMKDLEPYVANGGTYKGQLPEVVGKSIEEIKKSGDFKRNTNPKAILFAKEGDSIAKSVTSNYGSSENEMTSEEARAAFEEYQGQKEKLVTQEKALKKQKLEFGKTDTFELVGKDKTLIGEITATKEMPVAIKEIMDQVMKEKKARREEVLNHPARPLMKYVNKTDNKLPKIGSKTAFGKEGVQILKDLHFNDVQEANKALADYISKRNEFINPLSRLRLDERNAKFLRDKQQIMAEVEKKIRAEGKNRKAIIEDIRDYFYITEGEMKDVIGSVDYRLISDKEFDTLTEKIREESLKIAEHAVAVSEVEWTIAQKELHRVENLQQVMEFPTDLNKMTTEQLDILNKTLAPFERGDVFLGVREIETLGKNAGLPDVKTQRQVIEEVIGKRTNVPMDQIKVITTKSFDDLRGAISLARQNPFYEIMVTDAYQLKIQAHLNYQEIENKINDLTKKARDSRKKTLVQRLAPTDDMVIAYLEEGDLGTKSMIAKDMSPAELDLARYVESKYAEMRDFLVSREQLDNIRQNYYTHRPRGFLEAWLRDGIKKSPKEFVGAFAKAFKETIIDIHKMDEATFKILNEQTSEILPLEKFFKYSMRRSGQLIPTRNLAKAFLGYAKTFETKKGLDQYIPRMEAVARALTPTETTEGGVVKDTSLERFVKRWINTQKGRPTSLGVINPGDTIDTLLRAGVAFTRFLDLALRVPAQVMSLVGEESATWINIGNKRYLKGQIRAKTKQGKVIALKYEAFVGRTFWDKMQEQSQGIESKLGETLFAFYGIASRKANIHHLLGSLTSEEFKTGNISTERLTQLKMEMNLWRADDTLKSVMGATSVGGVFREHKSWAIPILNQTLSDLQDLGSMIKSGEFKKAAKSKEFGELFRATMLTLFLVLTISKIYQDLVKKGNGKRSFIEELEYRAMNDAFSFLSALSPTTLFTTPRLMSWMSDLSKAVAQVIGAMATGTKTTTGLIPGASQVIKSFTPKLFSPLLQPSEQDKIMTSITTSTLAAQKKVDAIDPKIVEPAKIAWEEVKKLGVGTPEADARVSELSDDEYTVYKSIKTADVDYWTELTTKVTPIVEQAFKFEFGSPEADKLIEGLTDDEYKSYQLVKKNLYGTGEAIAQPTDWDKQTFIQHISNLAKGWSTDPATAFDNLIHGGDWKITELKNGQIIVDRMPVSSSEAIKTKAAKNNADYKLDHVIAVKAGGTSRASNLNIITTEQWKENTPVEVYIIKALDTGKITGKEAREYMIRYKMGQEQNLSTELQKEYQTKYGGQPITFDEIKQEVVQ